jgi:hypothetical protein
MHFPLGVTPTHRSKAKPSPSQSDSICTGGIFEIYGKLWRRKKGYSVRAMLFARHPLDIRLWNALNAGSERVLSKVRIMVISSAF